MTEPSKADPAKAEPSKAEPSKAEPSNADPAKTRTPRRRITLDAQLMSYWDREAMRLDAMAANARWGWMARSYARKAERARAQAARSAAREADRRQVDAPEAQSKT